MQTYFLGSNFFFLFRNSNQTLENIRNIIILTLNKKGKNQLQCLYPILNEYKSMPWAEIKDKGKKVIFFQIFRSSNWYIHHYITKNICSSLLSKKNCLPPGFVFLPQIFWSTYWKNGTSLNVVRSSCSWVFSKLWLKPERKEMWGNFFRLIPWVVWRGIFF